MMNFFPTNVSSVVFNPSGSLKLKLTCMNCKNKKHKTQKLKYIDNFKHYFNNTWTYIFIFTVDSNALFKSEVVKLLKFCSNTLLYDPVFGSVYHWM